MLVPFILLLTISSSSPSVTALRNHSNGRAKRIAFGEPMPSLDAYKLYYFVQMRQSWACTSDQTDHEGSIVRCQMDYNRCGGALVHPEFVLTAAHCLMYFEVYVYKKGEQDDDVQLEEEESLDDWARDTIDEIHYTLSEAWKKLKHAAVSFFVVPKPKHTVYSEWALLMGSHDSFKMTQKRHAVKVFPHRVYPKDIFTEEKEQLLQKELNSWHDIALVRACQPFNIKLGEVDIAPMPRTLEGSREHFERIVKTAKLCLYAGFGRQDNDGEDALKSGYPRFPENLMMHTWRHSVCYSKCNKDRLIHPSTEHTCVLCSRHHGPKLGTTETGDSGSPVTCEGKFVATTTRSGWSLSRNFSRVDSYPLHCIINAISRDNLEHYKTLPYGSEYHPLRGTRMRRFPLPP